MKRFLLTTATAALIPAFALAQQASDDTKLLPKDQVEQSDQAMTDNSASDAEDMVDSTSEEATSADGEMTADSTDPMAQDQDATDTADANDTPVSEDPMAGAENASDVAESDTPMAEEEQSAENADTTDPMAAGNDTMETAEGTNSMAGDADLPSDMAMNEDGLGVTGDVAATSIIGNRVYVIEGEWDKTASFNAVAQDWTRVGSVQDIVISADGGIEGIVAEVGGFLGIGDKFVLLQSGEAKLVPLEGGGYDVVTWYSNDQLSEMQAYDTAQMQ